MKTNVAVKIMGNDFSLACEAEEKEILVKSADVLNQHLKAFRHEHPSLDTEQALLMGALKMTCELVSQMDSQAEQIKGANTIVNKTLSTLSE